MSEENVEIARQPLTVAADSRRRLEERFAVRFPRVLVLMTRAMLRLPQRSRLRQALIGRVVHLGFEALNRRDYEAAFGLYDPEIELNPPPGFGLGLEPSYRGYEERIRFQRRWNAEWGEVRIEPEEVIDFGDGRLLLLGRIKGSGLSSGAGVDHDWADILTIFAGRVIREQVFFDRADALEAAGLSE